MKQSVDLFELYEMIDKMQKIIGEDCRISISISAKDSLEIRTDWLYPDLKVRFIRHHHFMELKSVYDTNIILDLYCVEAKKEHERVINENRLDL